MPSNLSFLDTNFPTFTDEDSTEKKINTIQDYLYMTVESLRYALSNLGVGNMEQDFVDSLVSTSNSISEIKQTVTDHSASIESITSTMGTMQTDIDGRVKTAELNTKIGQYVDSSTGTSKIVAACSGTYLTQTSAASTYTTVTRTATLEGKVTADEAKISLVVSSSGSTNTVNTASIVTAINNSGSSVKINADHIVLTGYVTFSNLSTQGGTTIDGRNLITGTVTADTVKSTWVYAGQIDADQVNAGTFNMGSSYGYVGRGYGSNGTSTTYGVVLSSGNSGSSGLTSSDQYFIATNGGVLMMGTGSFVNCYSTRTVLCGGGGYKLNLNTNALVPESDQVFALGYSGCAYMTSYATNWSTVSDREKKENINYDVSAYRALFDKLKPCSFNYKSNSEIKLKKTGLIAQDVEEAMTEIGMQMKDFNAIRFEYDEDTGLKHDYSLCYDDFVCLLIDQVQQLKARVAALEA